MTCPCCMWAGQLRKFGRAMKPQKLLTLGLLALSSCAAAKFDATMPTDEQRAGLQYRQLSATEKESLRRSLVTTLKDPNAAQFKWMPVATNPPPGKPIGYCGLLNGKNSYGGCTGYRMFFALLSQNSKNEYDRGEITLIHGDGGGITFGVDNPDAITNELTERSCAWDIPISARQTKTVTLPWV